jgi:uncharacterized protein (TIGR02594 family)
MARYIVTSIDAKLFASADLAASNTAVPVNTEVDGDPVTPTGPWLKVSFGSATGFMRKADLHLEDNQPPEPVDGFTEFCTLTNDVARTRGVDRDYLMAVAWAGTAGLTQLGSATDARIGPFRFSKETWDRVLADPRAADLHLTAADRRRWIAQVQMGAVLTLQINDRLTAALGRPPTLGELDFGHVLGEDIATALLAGDRSRSFKDAFSASASADAYAKLKSEDPSLVPDGENIEGVFIEISRRLDTGYRDAAVVIDQQSDDIRFFHAEDGDPPWLMVAREEAFRGVYEFPGADNNARISEYHKVAGTADTTDDVPWCGAFIAYCMLRGGNSQAAKDAAKAVLPGSAMAARWLDWGEEAPADARPPGTIVVLKPQAANSSGHVGMLVEDAAAGQGAPSGKIRLLGGNQGAPQRVCSIDFDTNQVAAHGYRRLPRVASASPPVASPAGSTFGSLVPGGFFSADPMNLAIQKSIRTNNPGALNFTSWQANRKGFAGKAAPDSSGNVTTIYRTPEHGVASWMHLLSVIYGLSEAGGFALRTLARRYAGSAAALETVDRYVTNWIALSHGALTQTMVIETSDDTKMLTLAKAMFHFEAGVQTPLHDDQILFGIQQERAGTLPA